MNTVTAFPPAKKASPDYPIHELLAERWSPYAFADRPVSAADLSLLFEAARWAASSYNEQPWTYFIASRENLGEFARLLSCLVPANQAWAKAAPVLVLGVVNLRFSKTHKDNRVAVHDLGLASANLVMEATARGLSVHQMIGILPERARELYHIPEHHEAWTAMAIGFKANVDEMPAEMRERDLAPRQLKATSQFVFTGSWGQPSSLADVRS
ncbi:MAG: nitroreductase family protein [Undibacterium sp.]|nr:nitroreductase family protein [Opitutaceae bacterium]